MAGADNHDDLRAALLGLRKLKARVAELEGEARAPIAVIGMACRFPGADDPDAFWSLLERGVDAVGPIPADRWDAAAYLREGAAADAPGALRSDRAGVLSDVARFDADLFGISHREARSMDPQQRLLLESAWAALEDAGRRGDVEGSDTGVFLGVALTDWERRTLYHLDPTQADLYAGTGSFGSVAAGRISYALGLRGPAVALDTACSSSLVAIHLAVRSLRSGEARMALAGGVNLLLTPDPSLYFNQMGALSPTGSCKAFDAAADGYVRAEGVGVVVLKRLDHALADGDRVLAVIRGSAVNQDGRSNGLTAPSPDAQKAVLRAALRDAGAQAHEVGLVEAHGTGTPLGDPIEVEALAEVYGAGERPLVLGAVKSVIGHAEAAAGVAGFIKAVQALRAGRVPANLHFREANPRLRLAGTRLVVADRARPVDGLVGVSGFGMSGTNAHILLGPAPTLPALGAARRLQLVVLSAPDEARLDALRGAAAARLAGDVSLADAAFTAGVGRVHLAHRVAVVAADAAEAAARLAAAPVGLARRRARVGFVLGDGLADAALTALAEREPALAAIVASAEGRPGHAAWAAARLLEAWGIEAAAVIGAGGGEAGARALVGALDAPWSEAALARPQRWLGLGSDGTAAAVRDRADVWVGLGAPGDLTLQVGDDVERGLLDVVAALYLRGVEPKWEALHPARPRRVAWPGTAFAGPRLWLDDPVEQLRAERRRDERAWREIDVPVTLPAGRDAAAVLDLRGAVDEAAALRAVLDAVAVGRVVVLTRGCDVGPAAAIWGLGRVVASERPDRWGGLIDCGDADEAQVADAIARADGRDLRLVGGQLVERRLGPGPAAAPLSPSTDGVWWIAGGLGALGLATARWLVGRGVRRLALSARRDVATTPEIEALRASGAEVQVVRGDLSTVDGAAAARAAIGGPVVGVVHAAGLLEDRALGEVDDALLARHLAAKVGVLRALAAATAGDPLQALVVIGSATVSLGIPGQAAYAAANGALRAEVAALRGSGRPARLVELGPVEGGMADEATRRRLAAVGIGALSLDEAAELVMRPDGVAIRLDPARYGRSAAGPRIAAFLGVERPTALAAAPTVDRAAVVAEELARVLGRADLEGLDTSRGFFELGLDSMTAVAFARALEDRLGVPVPPTVAFDHGDLAALVAWLTPAEVQAPVAAAASRSDEPVAIIGMACRMPGADDPDAFWAALRSGVDLVRPIPASRWDVEALFDPTPGAAGRSYVREMATIDGVEGFDAAFFGVAPREAASLDPAQRLLLEVGVEALEHAGVPLESVSRSKTGVYVGIGPSDYARRFDVMNGPADAYAGTGNESSFAAGRLAYVLGAQGPAMGLNTACSTSLVTTHLAVQALQAGECELALAGGVNLVLSPETTVQLCQLQALSPTARCHTFSADADGYARGEGAGMLVLKRLSDARRDGDRVLGVIVGSAVNHDGPSAGLTVPSGSAQQALLRTALGRAGLRPDEVDLLEAHGTGTKLGDPIEMGAVKAVYGARPAERPLIVGSIKTHVGHLELAAGVAGVIATVEALRRREVAPHLHLGAVNPALDLDFPVRIPTAPGSLPAEGVVRGAVSSFGLSGTNAHVIVEGGAPDGVGEAPERSHHVLVWSARTAAAAEAMPARLAAALVGMGPAEVADLAWSLHTGRSRAKFGGAVVGADADALIAKLGEGVAPVEAARRPVVWMFTGQGSQARGMGAALRSHPAYRDVLDRADAVLLRLRGEALSAVIDEDGPRLDDTAWTQPALVAVELGLAAVLTSLGMAPDLVIGHSVGEIAAACVAGALDVEAAITLAAERGRLMSALPAGGGMVQVALREDLVRERLRPGLDVAAVNAGDETVVSGDLDALDALVVELEAANVRCRRLVVSHAFHSARMDPMLDTFEAVVAATPLRTPRIPVLSNLEARPVTEALTQPAYWRRHVREAVRFADALRTAPERALLVELGPHPVLAGLAARVRSDVVVVPTLRRGRPAWEGLAEAVGALACRGVDLDLAAWDAPWRRAKVAVPLTPWAKARHWVERVDSRPRRAGPRAAAGDGVGGGRRGARRAAVVRRGGRRRGHRGGAGGGGRRGPGRLGRRR
jgi:acyl transferase domain-containing protein/acyl carrier protein